MASRSDTEGPVPGLGKRGAVCATRKGAWGDAQRMESMNKNHKTGLVLAGAAALAIRSTERKAIQAHGCPQRRNLSCYGYGEKNRCASRATCHSFILHRTTFMATIAPWRWIRFPCEANKGAARVRTSDRSDLVLGARPFSFFNAFKSLGR